ncbi:hypothetical protein BH24ACT5_BH24ACT5_14760 [soil metagenome]
MSTTIRVSDATRERFSRLSAATGRPMMRLLDEAADALERRLFFDRLTARYDELRRNADTWAEIEAERSAEGSALGDSSL